MVTVVVGHALWPMFGESRVADSLYLTIFAFHIPALVAANGMVASTQPVDRATFGKLARQLLLPYIVFETLYWLFADQVLADPIRTPMAMTTSPSGCRASPLVRRSRPGS